MSTLPIVGPLIRSLRARKRESALAESAKWPTVQAILLKSVVVPKDPLAEGTTIQDMQIESPFSFTYNGSYYGGYARSVPMSDSEAHRAIRNVAEDAPVTVRCNPQNPDEAHVLAQDNPQGPYAIWSC
jgi:flagella basal body P-ring formation protein FlgA